MCHGACAISILISFNFFFSKSIIVYAHINPTSTTSTLLPYDLDCASVSLWPRLCISQMLDIDSTSVQLKTLCLPRDNLWPLQLVFKPWNSPLSISLIFFFKFIIIYAHINPIYYQHPTTSQARLCIGLILA